MRYIAIPQAHRETVMSESRASDETVDSPAPAPRAHHHDNPESIGPFRILERIGEGGMGVIYKAEQRTPVRRIVALKVIKLGMDTKEVLARFEAERQALALMSHANIARVLDGATKPPAAKATVDLIRAMARQQLKKSAQAKELLDAAMTRIDSELTKPGDGTINSPENWLICHILRREAEQDHRQITC
jgi:hypothetical protein